MRVGEYKREYERKEKGCERSKRIDESQLEKFQTNVLVTTLWQKRKATCKHTGIRGVSSGRIDMKTTRHTHTRTHTQAHTHQLQKRNATKKRQKQKNSHVARNLRERMKTKDFTDLNGSAHYYTHMSTK